MESFKASVQYGDWEGTAAADDAHTDLREYLEGKKLINPNEFLIAASFFVDEDYSNVRAFMFQGGRDFESVKDHLAAITGPIPVREVNVKLTPKEFIGLFKRFDVILTWKGFELEGREYSVIES
jgi:hypothetical protein